MSDHRELPLAPNTPPPMAMLAELTHRCPLACPYCSNPLALKPRSNELTTAQWGDVFRQASDLGVLHLHLSGGEPAARRDLVELVRVARDCGLYTNLITSGIGLTEKRLDALSDAGLDHVQLSLQGVDAKRADHVADYAGGHDHKLAVARWIVDRCLPLTVNAVCHRNTMADIPQMVALALDLGARRLEIATVQFHGWALKNRAALMPSKEQVADATKTVERFRAELEGRLVIDYVPADYHATYPKACLGGWGQVGINVDPTGLVLPCHAAETIPTLTFDRVLEKSLEDIWYHAPSFNAFRGTDWMQEPCRSCERKAIDFGGCRCQAMSFAGSATATDPACHKSPLKNEMYLLAKTESSNDAFDGFVWRGR